MKTHEEEIEELGYGEFFQYSWFKERCGNFKRLCPKCKNNIEKLNKIIWSEE